MRGQEYCRSVASPLHVQQPTVEISNFVVGLMREHVGRGPTRARTNIGDRVLTVVLEEVLTAVEHTLARGGHGDLVCTLRASFHETIVGELIAGVQQITGRRVRECLSATAVDSDIVVLTFLMEPIGLAGSMNGARRRG